MNDMCDHFVYWLLDAAGDCIYVGSTQDPERRWREHYRRIGGEIVTRRVDGPFTRKAALAKESAEMAELNPKYNEVLKAMPIRFSTRDAYDCVSSPDEAVLTRATELLVEKYMARRRSA